MFHHEKDFEKPILVSLCLVALAACRGPHGSGDVNPNTSSYVDTSPTKAVPATKEDVAPQADEIPEILKGDKTKGAIAHTQSPVMTPPVVGLKLALDMSDEPYLKLCGAEATYKSLANNSKRNDSIIAVTKLKISDADERSAKKQILLVPTDTAASKTLNAVVTSSPANRLPDQAFWIFSDDKTKAIKLSSLVRSSDFSEKDPILRYELFVHQYDFKKDMKVQQNAESGDISYQINPDVVGKLITKYAVTFDVDSAWWLKTMVDGTSECMESKGYAAPGVSRDSVRDYVLFTLFFKDLKPVVSRLQ